MRSAVILWSCRASSVLGRRKRNVFGQSSERSRVVMLSYRLHSTGHAAIWDITHTHTHWLVKTHPLKTKVTIAQWLQDVRHKNSWSDTKENVILEASHPVSFLLWPPQISMEAQITLLAITSRSADLPLVIFNADHSHGSWDLLKREAFSLTWKRCVRLIFTSRAPAKKWSPHMALW